MPSLSTIVFILILILVEAPILLMHEWNHHHRPPALSPAIGPTGPTWAILSSDTIEALPHEHGERSTALAEDRAMACELP